MNSIYFWIALGAVIFAGYGAGAATPGDSLRVKTGLTQSGTDSSAILLSSVLVTGKSVEDHIMKIDLNKVPVNTSQDLLRKVPGLFIAQHAGGGKAEQIFLRGFDNDHGTDISISADGMPVNMVSHAHGQGYSDLHFLIPERWKISASVKVLTMPKKGILILPAMSISVLSIKSRAVW